MTLPTGTISMNQVNTELGRSSTTSINLNESVVRTLAGVASGSISMNDLRGKSYINFSPAGGDSAATATELIDENGNQIVITCSQSATWTYTRSGAAGSPNSGTSTSTTRTFDITGTGLTIWNVSGTAGGVTKYWRVTIEFGI